MVVMVLACSAIIRAKHFVQHFGLSLIACKINDKVKLYRFRNECTILSLSVISIPCKWR